MNTKLTLRLDHQLIEAAKREAEVRGTSVSQMVADYIRAIQKGSPKGPGTPFAPVTQSLHGALKGCKLDRTDYRRHLEVKHR
jgi:hypothetical protein